jgi:hypothetical protein
LTVTDRHSNRELFIQIFTGQTAPEDLLVLPRRPQLALEVVVEFHDPEPFVRPDPLAFPSSLLPRLILWGGTNGGNLPGKI